MRTQAEIISHPNYLIHILLERQFSRHEFSAYFLLFRKFRRRKSTRIALEFILLVSQKFVINKIINTLKLFLFTVDSSVLLNERAQFLFHDICFLLLFLFFFCIADCIKLYKSIVKKVPKILLRTCLWK